jgi:hypothetical protein
MADLQGRVRERLREQLLRNGASKAFEDPALFAEVERLLSTATDVGDANALILPELLGEPARWRLEVALFYASSRADRARHLRQTASVDRSCGAVQAATATSNDSAA